MIKTLIAEGFFLTVLLMLSHPILHLYHMKKRVFIPAILIFIIISGFTQISLPVKKVHAFKQASIPGILPGYREETDIGKTNKAKPKQNFNYWFFIEIAKTEKINVTGLWIAGVPHDIKAETIKELPVKKIIFTGLDINDTTIMMPVTKNKVMLIYPSGESKDTIIRSKYIRDITRVNELVIRYLWKNKVYYTTVKKLKELNPDVRP
jgi:hypothetical protein